MYDMDSITQVIEEFGITDAETVNDLLWEATAFPFAPGHEVASTLRELFQRMAEGTTPEELIGEAYSSLDESMKGLYEHLQSEEE